MNIFQKFFIVFMSLFMIQGCGNLMPKSQPPQPDRIVSSHYSNMTTFRSDRGHVDTSYSFVSMIPVLDHDLTDARINLMKEGSNLCWETSDGRFFVVGEERLAITNETTNLVWKISCDPVGYFKNKVDNKKVYSPEYLFKYGDKILK